MTNIYDLQKNEKLKVLATEYTVTGAIEFGQGTYRWKEYKLVGSKQELAWLSVEKEDGKDRFMLSENLNSKFFPDDTFVYNELFYNVFDAGNAKVVACWGDVDVDLDDSLEFKEFLYITPEGKKVPEENDILLSYEKWSNGEEEFSKGRYIDSSDIKGNIAFDTAVSRKEIDTLVTQLTKTLPLGSYIQFENRAYYISSRTKLSQKNYDWYELGIKGNDGSHWLSVEKYGSEVTFNNILKGENRPHW